MKNRFLEKYRVGEKTVGTFTHLMSEAAVEALGRTGLDYVIMDTEHSPLCPENSAQLIDAAAGAGLDPFVRVDAIARSPVLKALDAGAAGLIVPQVETVGQVRALIGWAKFAPLGERGYCPTRDGGWGCDDCYTGGMESYMEQANAFTALVPQCETRGCLESIEEIAALDGVDGIFIGPFDLSIALGKPGRFDDAEVKAAFARVLAACKANGKPCIMFTGSPDAARGYLAQGFDSITLGLDISFLIDGVQSAIDRTNG